MGSGMVIGKSADDRVGLYVLAEVARRLAGRPLAARLVLVGTVQEEGIDTFIAWVGARPLGEADIIEAQISMTVPQDEQIGSVSEIETYEMHKISSCARL